MMVFDFKHILAKFAKILESQLVFRCSMIEVILYGGHSILMKMKRDEILNDPEFQNFMLQKPSLAQYSLDSYITGLEKFTDFTEEPFYRTVYELRSLQNDRIENNLIIRFDPNQSRINLLQYEFVDYLRKQGCGTVTIDTYIRGLRAVLNTLGIILPKAPKLNSVPKDWYLLTKEDIKYVLDISDIRYNAAIAFAACTGLRRYDLCSLTVRDFMVATKEYHDSSEVEDFLDSAPKGMIGFWELIPHKTRNQNIKCKVCNTPESSDMILRALKERVKYYERRKREGAFDLSITKNDPLFATRTSRFKGFYNPAGFGTSIGRYKYKLREERERVYKYKFEQGEISKETYEESIASIPNFHAHGLRKFFITTLAKNRVDARISALMEGHRPPIATDSHYVDEDFLKESVKEEYMRCIPDLSFENVEVRFLTSEERKSLQDKIKELQEENETMKLNMQTYVNRAVEEKLDDAISHWMTVRKPQNF